ncbi:MAG: ATP-grasp domain-containing protein [Chloroflexi bacterium]|nr:ATP-grasp domain-containing protein [Chloroflexota bacterium]
MSFTIFVAPFLTEFNVRAIDYAAHMPGVRLGVISQEAQEKLPQYVRSRLTGHWRVDDAQNAGQLVTAAEALARQIGAPIHRLFGGNEQIQMPMAEARERLGVAGMSSDTVRNFRDKAQMKEVLRSVGLPCARHSLLTSEAAAWAFAGETGYPLVVKPPAGAASQATYKVENATQLRDALDKAAPSPANEVLIEEFIVGEEHSFDTFSLHGKPVFHSLTHYLPQPLDVIRNPWIQWCVLLPHEIESPRYDDIREIGWRALEALGMDTGVSHLEWFRRRDGSIAISEVAARPPGAQIMTLISRANEFDALGAWVKLIAKDTFEVPTRRYAVGAAYLRSQGEGRVKAIHGLETAMQEVGHLVTDAKLPAIGQEKSKTYEGEGFIIVRHPETLVVQQALTTLINAVRIEMG